jgi:hypothetical protein
VIEGTECLDRQTDVLSAHSNFCRAGAQAAPFSAFRPALREMTRLRRLPENRLVATRPENALIVRCDSSVLLDVHAP